jgi:hypothetical protein
MTEHFVNPGFEGWTAGVPDNWNVVIAGGSTITQETGIIVSGLSSLKMTTDGTPSVVNFSQQVTLIPNKKYTLSFWRAHLESGKSVKIQIRNSGSNVYLYYDAVNDEWLWDTAVRFITVPNTLDMEQFFIGFQTHPLYSVYTVYVVRGDDATNATIYFDDFSLYDDDADDDEDKKLMSVAEPIAIDQAATKEDENDSLTIIDGCDELTQFSIPAQRLSYNSGGMYKVKAGDQITGHTSGATAIVEYVFVSTGSWAAGTAAGYLYLSSVAGVFINGETLDVGGNINVATLTTALTNTGMTLSLDTSDKMVGAASVVVNNLSISNVIYLKIKKASGVWELSGANLLTCYCRTSSGQNLKMAIGELNGFEIKSGDLGAPSGGAKFKKYKWDISAIDKASRDGVTIVHIGKDSDQAIGATFKIDWVVADPGPSITLTRLPSGQCQTYPQVHNFQSFGPQFGGTGEDGDWVADASYTIGTIGGGQFYLYQFNNLTINAGIAVALNDKVSVILVKETLTINGAIEANNEGGAGGGPRLGGGPGAFGGGGGGGGITAGSTRGGGGGGAGQDGEDGVVDGSAEGGGKRTPTNVQNWGGNGYGVGGKAPGSLVGVAGTRILPDPLCPIPFEIARLLYGGGGGGGSTATGGVGGYGAGVIWIEAKNIVWGAAGSVEAVGRNGGNASVNGGGGGGGGGGCVLIHYHTKTGSATIAVSGGAAGLKAGTGLNGGAGAAGIGAEFKVG